MKFSEEFKKNKGEAAAPEAAKDSGKKKHKPDPKKLDRHHQQKTYQKRFLQHGYGSCLYRDRGCDQYDRRISAIQIYRV